MSDWRIAATMATAAAGGCGLAAWAACHPSSQLFGPTIRRTRRASTLALTFDDGPNPAVTPHLLRLFERWNIHASFFLIGRHVRACPQLTAEIAARGHTLGNHSDTHPDLLWRSSRGIHDELARCQEAIRCAAGCEPAWMRPPFGRRGPHLNAVVRQGGWAGVVMWSAGAHDWTPQPAQRIIRRLRRVRGGDIVLLHDGDHRVLEGDRERVVQALDYWLPRWKDAGLEFVTLDQIARPEHAKPSEEVPSRG